MFQIGDVFELKIEMEDYGLKEGQQFEVCDISEDGKRVWFKPNHLILDVNINDIQKV
ncbi:hypothetical protein [Listeria booriae]|uniref:Uncharacterized protein n=1 Tax=Listeria booriae TaxID=1552123 RepID=A0A841ZYJ2_9LIST|nr:hypothetical protein [Listeria booriae]MBC1565062.1 hypothetical protein [Listeria booriae]